MVLLEQKSEQLEDFIERSMVIYLAPAETMKTYLDGMKYTSQKMKEKMIGVDTARYLLTVNDRSDEIYTGGDGCWGSETELYRQVGNQRVSDAVMISMALPDYMNFDDMRRMARYFFPDMQQINKGEKKRNRGNLAR